MDDADRDRFEPQAIDVARSEGVTITFHDGFVARFDLPSLRVECPCAACRDLRERGQPAWPRPGGPTEITIESAQLHGGWGLHVDWSDGHSTGIYPFESLRRWAEEESG